MNFVAIIFFFSFFKNPFLYLSGHLTTINFGTLYISHSPGIASCKEYSCKLSAAGFNLRNPGGVVPILGSFFNPYGLLRTRISENQLEKIRFTIQVLRYHLLNIPSYIQKIKFKVYILSALASSNTLAVFFYLFFMWILDIIHCVLREI